VKAGVTSITFVSPPFKTLAQRRCEALGLPDVPLIWVDHPMMNLNLQQVDALAERVLPEVLGVIAARVRPAEGVAA